MKLAPQSRDILRQYKALINARRRDAGQRELTTAQVMDEICEYMTCQCAVYIGGHFIQIGHFFLIKFISGIKITVDLRQCVHTRKVAELSRKGIDNLHLFLG